VITDQQPAPRVLLSGIDGLDCLVHGDVSSWASTLDQWKSAAQATTDPLIVKVADEPFRILPKGWPGFPYVLEHDRGHVGVNPKTGMSRRAPVKVSMRAEALHASGGPDGERVFWEAVILPELLDCDAFERPMQASRMDIHVDVAGVRFNPHEVIDGVVARSDEIAPIIAGGELCGVSIGHRGGPVFIRLYDKLRHIDKTGESAYLLDTYGTAGLRNGEDVWRLEVELRRSLFNTVRPKIHTASDAIASQASLWRYAVVDWGRLAVPGSATRRERCETDPRWMVYQQAELPAGSVVERIGRHRHAPRLRHFLPVIRGCVVKAGALLGADDWDTAWRRIGWLVTHDAQDRGIDLDGEVTIARLNNGEPLSSVLRDLARLFPIPDFEDGAT
jgi:hypothetical protein